MDWKKHSLYIIYFVVFTLWSACTSDTMFSKFNKINSEGWVANESLPFEFHVSDTSQTYDIVVAVRHDKNYEYSNMWLKVVNQDKQVLDKDKIIQFKLADKTGQWLGKCSNTYCTQHEVLKKNFSFQDTGKVSLSITQHMRVENLTHIKAVGLTVTKSKMDQL